MYIRNVDITTYRAFLELNSQWEYISNQDAYERLALLTNYFAQETGIRFQTYASIAWKIRFKDLGSLEGEKIRRDNFFSLLNKIKKEVNVRSIPGEKIYDQFWVSLHSVKNQNPVQKNNYTEKITSEKKEKPVTTNNTGNSLLNRMRSFDLRHSSK